MGEISSVRGTESKLSGNVVPFVSAGFALAVGLTVLVGWHLGIEAFVRILPRLPEMPYSAAWGMAVAGAGMLLAVLQRRRAAIGCGLAVGILGLARVAEYALGVDWGMGRLVLASGSPVSGDGPIGMSLGMAICFMVTGLAISIMPERPSFRQRSLVLVLLGISIFAFGAAGLLGAAVPYQPAHIWVRLPRIALHAAAGFMSIGVGITDFGWRQHSQREWLIRDLRNSVIIYTTFGMLLMIVVSALLAILPMYDRLCQAQHSYLVHSARSKANTIEQYLWRVKAISLQIASRTYARQLLEAYNRGEFSRQQFAEQSEPILRDALRHSQEICGIVRLDKRGEPLVEIGALIPRECWPDAVSQIEGLVVSDPVLLESSFHLIVASPILTADKLRVGADLVLVRFENIEEILADRSELDSRNELLLSAGPAGTRVTLSLPCRGDRVRLVPLSDSTQRTIERADVTKPGILEPFAMHGQALTAFAPVGGTDWIVLSTADPDRLYYPVNRHLMLVLLAVAVLAVLGAVGIYVLLRPLTGGILVRTDLLEQQIRAATAALAESEERFQLAVRGTDAGIWDWDLRTDKVYFSPRWKSMLGYAEEEIGDDYTEWERRVHPDDLPRALEAIRAYRSGETNQYELEHRLRHKDGTYRWILARGTLVRDAQGVPYRMVGSHIDVTGRRLAEERLKTTAEALEQSNRDLEQFAYTASHDLQEPLRMMSAYLQAIAQQYRDQLPANAQTLIDLSLDAGQRMQQLINDLLEFSRVQTRAGNFVPVDCNEVFDEAVENLKLAIEENAATVTREDLPTVTGDRSLLVQLLQNLIGNAIKFHGKDPPRVHVAAAPSAGRWTFSVRDNGIGIDPEYSDIIFQVFQRLHSSDAYPGTGIGLAVCKRIVERHGGRIWFESEPGKGTTFFFTLPALDPAADHPGGNGADPIFRSDTKLG